MGRTDLQQPSTGLRVGVAASGRFHLLDLARELDELGVDVRFYSYVPRKRAAMFGLPNRCHVGLLPIIFPLVAFERLVPWVFPVIIERLMCWALDILVILRMRRCDVFVCMSGIYLQAARFAKWRYGAKVIMHRGSRHILSQKALLASVPHARQVTSFMVQRELQGYSVSDHIAVPSAHVVESFAPWPEHASKLFMNPYGVDVYQFPLRRTAPTEPTVLYVGQWSYRKGVDTLVDAINGMDGVRLVHVGAVSDAPFPDNPRFKHYEHVSQEKLKDFYEMSSVFALVSREDGFGCVLSQALCSGLPVVCTDRTGGPDLAHFFGLSRLIRVIPGGDVNALRRNLKEALDDAGGRTNLSGITGAEREQLSWRRYAVRELQLIKGVPCILKEHSALKATYEIRSDRCPKLDEKVRISPPLSRKLFIDGTAESLDA